MKSKPGDQERAKTCPACHKADITSFSSCRYCGTKYNAVIKKESSFDQKIIMQLCAVALAIGAFLYGTHIVKVKRAEKIAPLSNAIQIANKPRLVEFYAPWCGACRAYEPILAQCQTKYAGQVDFQRLNLDDPNNDQLRSAFGVSSIPATFIFNNKGEEIKHFVGCYPFSELDNYLRNPELYK